MWRWILRKSFRSFFRKMLLSAFLLRFKANYLQKMHAYPGLSLWISVALAKISSLRLVLIWHKKLFYLVGTVILKIFFFLLRQARSCGHHHERGNNGGKKILGLQLYRGENQDTRIWRRITSRGSWASFGYWTSRLRLVNGCIWKPATNQSHATYSNYSTRDLFNVESWLPEGLPMYLFEHKMLVLFHRSSYIQYCKTEVQYSYKTPFL